MEPTNNNQGERPTIYPEPTTHVTSQVPSSSPAISLTNPTTNAPKKSRKVTLVFILAIIFSFLLGIGGGIILQDKVFDKPSVVEELIQTQLEAYYGENWEELSAKDFEENAQDLQNTGQDIERTADINAIHTQLEVLFNDNGYYPVNDVFEDSKEDVAKGIFRAYLDEAALEDPEGRMINSEGSDYTYIAGDCSGSRCQSYVLTSILIDRDEDVYVKNSLNR